MMATYHFYTVTIDGKDYAVDLPYRKWADVEFVIGLPRNQIRRGASSSTPRLTPDVLVAAHEAIVKAKEAHDDD